jgi:hypothetical protein
MSEGDPPGKPTDMRRFARGTEIRLAVAVVVFITIVGNALIWLLFGRDVALPSLGCSIVGALLFGGLYGLMALMGWWSERLWR